MARREHESTRERNDDPNLDLDRPQVLFYGNGNGKNGGNEQLVLPSKPTKTTRVLKPSTDLIIPPSTYYLDQAVNGQANTLALARRWEIERDLMESSVKTAYSKLIGELLELMVAISEGKSPAQCLSELGDVYAYALKLLSLLFDRVGVKIIPTVKETLPSYERMIRQAETQKNINFQLPNRMSVEDVLGLFRLATDVAAACTGNQVNHFKYELALGRLNGVLANPGSYHPTPDGGQETTKKIEKQVIKLFLSSFDIPLNGGFDIANAATAVPELLNAIRHMAKENFGYIHMDELVSLFYLFKNEINYPIFDPNDPATYRANVRKDRDNWPGSSRNRHFSSPEEMRAYYFFLNSKQLAELVAFINLYWSPIEDHQLSTERTNKQSNRNNLVLPAGVQLR